MAGNKSKGGKTWSHNKKCSIYINWYLNCEAWLPVDFSVEQEYIPSLSSLHVSQIPPYRVSFVGSFFTYQWWVGVATIRNSRPENPNIKAHSLYRPMLSAMILAQPATQLSSALNEQSRFEEIISITNNDCHWRSFNTSRLLGSEKVSVKVLSYHLRRTKILSITIWPLASFIVRLPSPWEIPIAITREIFRYQRV